MRIANPLVALGLLAGTTASRPGSPALPAAGRGLLLSRGKSSFGQLVRSKGDSPAAAKAKKRSDADEPSLDPALGQTAHWSPLTAAQLPPVSPAAPVEQQARRSLEDLLPALVRRIAWSGDARRGTMRLELAAGELSGATLVVHADDGRVKVELRAPAGTDPAVWKARIEGRLAARGLAVDAVEVD